MRIIIEFDDIELLEYICNNYEYKMPLTKLNNEIKDALRKICENTILNCKEEILDILSNELVRKNIIRQTGG